MKLARFVLATMVALAILPGCSKAKKTEESGPRITGGGPVDTSVKPEQRSLGGSGNK